MGIVLVLLILSFVFGVIHNVSKQPMTEALAIGISVTCQSVAFFAFSADEFIAAFRYTMYGSIGIGALAFVGHLIRAARE